MTPTADQLAILRLTLTPGLGPVLIQRLISQFGSAAHVLEQSAAAIAQVRGVGATKADLFLRGFGPSVARAEKELQLCDSLGVQLVTITEPAYPPLLAQIPTPPPLLYVKGTIDHLDRDRFPCAIVGSRKCTAYGIEQAERFAVNLARSGVTVVSGGAFGIDAAAHRATLRGPGRTIAVLGCGLANCYPAEHRQLFDDIAGHGAVISELPLETPPSAENFPARNRIISGLSLGVLVIEAQRRSGALITARLAAEDHGREVFALPGRVDSNASEGSLDLLKQGGAVMVTEPADVLAALESPARHLAEGTHAERFVGTDPIDGSPLFKDATPSRPAATIEPAIGLTPGQSATLAALTSSLTLDQLQSSTGRAVSELRSDLTILEIRRLVVREGTTFRARSAK